MQKSDILNAQVQVSTIGSALTKAESNIANTSDGPKLLMNMELNQESRVFLTGSLEQRMRSEFTPILSPMRADVIAMQRTFGASNTMMKSLVMNFLPKINAFGSYEFISNRS